MQQSWPQPAARRPPWSWRNGNSSRSQVLGGQPASSAQSRARCAWSAYPHRPRPRPGAAGPSSGRGTPRTAPPAGTPSGPARLLPDERAEPPAAVADLVGHLGDRLAAGQRGQRAAHLGARAASPCGASARSSARPTSATLLRAGQPVQPLGQVGQLGSHVAQLEQLAGAAPPPVRPSSARAPAVVSPSWIPRCAPSWWIAAGRGVQPGHRRPPLAPAPARRPTRRRAAPRPAARTSGSCVGSPRCTPGAPRSPSYATSEATYGASTSGTAAMVRPYPPRGVGTGARRRDGRGRSPRHDPRPRRQRIPSRRTPSSAGSSVTPKGQATQSWVVSSSSPSSSSGQVAECRRT